jgi:hypothetical protein
MLDGHAVPGVAVTPLKGDLAPTIIAGRSARADDELVLGRDTLDIIDAEIGDVVRAQISSEGIGVGDAAGDPVELRVVGVATFPPVIQIGTDVPRLGVGALVTDAVIARTRGGFHDAVQSETAWFTDTEPAEIRQLDAAMPYLRGSMAVGLAVLIGIVAYSMWMRARAAQRELSILRAMGCTGRQLDVVTAWLAAPLAIVSIVLGIPIGVTLGRFAFRQFARSLALVDSPSTTPVTIGALLCAALVAGAVAIVVGLVVRRQTRVASILRAG